MEDWRTPQVIVSMITACIASSAFIVAAYNAYQTRRHQRLSVMPYLDVYIPIQSEKTGLYLRNNGSGLLVVKEIVMETDEGKTYDFSHTNIHSAFNELNDACFTANIFPSGASIRPGEQLCLLEFRQTPDDRHLPIAYKVFSKSELTIKFESLYKQKFTYKNKLNMKVTD